MGAQLVTKSVPKDLNKVQIRKWYDQLKLDQYLSYLDDPEYPRDLISMATTAYTGDFATFSQGLEFDNRVLSNKYHAVRALMRFSRKWERAVCVPYLDTNNQKRFLVGGWAAN